MLKEVESVIFIPNRKGQNTKEVNLSAKGKSSQRAKHHYQIKREICDTINTNKVQRSLDKENSILIAKKEVQKLKEQAKNRRAMFAAKRKAKF